MNRRKEAEKVSQEIKVSPFALFLGVRSVRAGLYD